ncbi:MAG: ABC transporter ATP-binding protein [Planctomycetota bacterium]|nr:MAG: ABC transporter ATP-binding protein [Planctomycetota bacterium]
MDPYIDAHGLRKEFGSILAVDGVDLVVRPGEVLGFLGPNGAGKSTTMKMVTGFLEPTAGTIRILGADMLADPRQAKRHIGYLPEGAPAWPDMTVAEFLAFIAEVRGFDRPAAARRTEELVELVHLGGVFHQTIETLSKGFKRRVGLAQAIYHDPPVLVLDEPTDGLDPNQKHEVRELIRRMGEKKAIVLSTHILEEVEAVCTRAVIINRGRTVFDGSPDELDAQAPTEVERNRLDWVFRHITTSDTAVAGDAA